MTKLKLAAALQKGVARLTAIDGECRALYQERDRIETQWISAIQASAGGELWLPDGRPVRLRSNFVDRNGLPRNVAFKTVAVKQWEIVVG